MPKVPVTLDVAKTTITGELELPASSGPSSHVAFRDLTYATPLTFNESASIETVLCTEGEAAAFTFDIRHDNCRTKIANWTNGSRPILVHAGSAVTVTGAPGAGGGSVFRLFIRTA